jgi:hypothetical protein
LLVEPTLFISVISSVPADGSLTLSFTMNSFSASIRTATFGFSLVWLRSWQSHRSEYRASPACSDDEEDEPQ